jgi:hypothetical protein
VVCTELWAVGFNAWGQLDAPQHVRAKWDKRGKKRKYQQYEMDDQDHLPLVPDLYEFKRVLESSPEAIENFEILEASASATVGMIYIS